MNTATYLSSTRGLKRGAPRDVRVGAGSYTDGDPTSYTDSNGVAWVIVNNGCNNDDGGWLPGALDPDCSSTDIQNAYWATQRVRRYSFDPVPSLRDKTLDGVKVLVDKFAAGRTPDIDEPSTSKALGEGEDAPLDPSASDAGPSKPLATKPPPLPAYSATAASDASLASIQRALIGLGYPVGPAGADGKAGAATANAIVRFKKAHGVAPADTAVTPAFRSALAAAVRARNAASADGGMSAGWIVVGVIAAAAAGLAVKHWVG